MLTFEAKPLAWAVQNASSVVGSSTIPILANIAFFPEGTTCRVVAQSSTMCATYRVEFEGKSEPFTVPADKIAAIAKTWSPADSITMENLSGSIEIKRGRNKWKLQSLPADDYPNWSSDEMPTGFAMDCEAFLDKFSEVAIAIPSKDHRLSLTGCFVKVARDKISLTGTDGKIMRREEFAASEITGESGSATFPVEWFRALRGLSSDVNVSFGERTIMAQSGNATIEARTVSGRYPDVEAVIPREFEYSIEFEVPKLIAAMRSVEATADKLSRVIVIEPHDGEARLETMSADVGISEAFVPSVIEGKSDSVAYNLNLLLSLVNQCSGKVKLRLKSNQSPTVIESGGDGSLRILMPIKMSDALAARLKKESEENDD